MAAERTMDISDMRTLEVLSRISALHPSLSKVQRQVADFISEHPEAVKGWTIAEIAKQCGVGQATIARFCRALGFDGYSEFKLALVEDLGQTAKAVPIEHQDVTLDDSPESVIRKVMAVDIQVIANTVTTLDTQEFVKAIEALLAAKKVAAFGSGGSLAVSMDMYYRLLRSGIHCLMSVDTHFQTMNAVLLESGDVGIAISYSGETKDVVGCAELAKKSGATVICITNHPKSTLAKLCDICLSASSTKTRWISDAIAARIGQMAVIDALCVGICLKNQECVSPLVKRIEQAAATKRI